MPSTFDPTYDTELDAGREPIAAPDSAPAILPPGRRGDRFSQEQASDAEIGAAVGQLNAGQPVTALPRQEWSPAQGQSFAAKLDEFDRQAKVARAAAQQAAIDAQMLNQMSLVAKSAKDIEIQRRNIDVMRATARIRAGENPVNVMMDTPGLFSTGAGYAAAVRAGTPAAPPTFGTTPGGNEYVQGSNVRIMPSATAGMPAAQKYLNLADQEDAQAEFLRQKGDVPNYQVHKERADNYRQLAAPRVSSTSVKFDEAGKPVVEMSTGPKPTTAMSTKAQEKTVQYEDALALINQLEKSLAPSDVGAAGLVGEMVLDRTLPQFGVDQYFSGARVKKRAALGALRESLLRQVSDDPRFSNVDREQISKILPSTGLFESQPDALARMDQVKEILQDRIKAYAGATGASAPASVKTRETIIGEYNAGVKSLSEAVKANRMTPEQAHQRALELHRQMTEAVRRFH